MLIRRKRNERFKVRDEKSKNVPLLQLGAMDSALKTALWNLLVEEVESFDNRKGPAFSVLEAIWAGFFEQSKHEFKISLSHPFEAVHLLYGRLKWEQVYDLMEFLADNYSDLFQTRDLQFKAKLNRILEQESSGYRFLKGSIIPITDECELGAIDDAIDAAEKSGMEGVYSHLHKAAKKISERPKPDTANCVKEAISALESVSETLTNKKASGLKEHLRNIEELFPNSIHSSLKEALLKLYGYASDHPSIRHGRKDAQEVPFEDAKLILVVSSAVVHYLIAKR